MTLASPQLLQRPLDRSDYHRIVQNALASREFGFARQAILGWLAAYPGDLQAGLYFAHALVGENRASQALRVLRGLCSADPEYLEAVQTLLEVIETIQKGSELGRGASGAGTGGSAQFEAMESEAQAHWFALTGRNREGWLPASWGGPLWFARLALEQGDLCLAENLIQEAWENGPAHPLLGITHLQYLALEPGTSLEARCDLARSYHDRWQDTIAFMLRLADWSLEGGQSGPAVALLHQAAARDVGGQIAVRLWSREHPYRSLWPASMKLNLNLMVPAVVAARLGWNRLTEGVDDPAASETAAEDATAAADELPASPEAAAPPPLEDDAVEPVSQQPIEEAPLSAPATGLEPHAADPERKPARAASARRKARPLDQELRAVEQEFERLAHRFKLPGIESRDGRFPIYVILTFRKRLVEVYGAAVTGLLESEMAQLGDAIRSRPGWGAWAVFADDLACTQAFGSQPVKPGDPWSLKLMLADLDDALANQGARIGALLILGGPEIVPFHHLPNPTNDPDVDVPSDNPYATRDENYFVPEWPVGRLPGGAGSDARMLLEALRRYQIEHRRTKRKVSWKERLIGWVTGLFDFVNPQNRRNFGYTAEVWRKAAAAVFGPIGKPGWLHVSPPSGLPPADQAGEGNDNQDLHGVPELSGRLGYFNLHGFIHATEWFGHRDFLRASNQPDFPVALRPKDIQPGKRSSQFPRLVFSEACHGMFIHGRSRDEVIALKFLSAGSLAVVGSTSMAYGSISARPMVAADLLGHTFWRFLKDGMPAGEALRQAKIYLVREMDRRQGYLDGEDQKTLISFVLYGDPLAEPLQKERDPKTLRYRTNPLAEIFTISDAAEPCEATGPVPLEVLDGVRRAVAKYLPGMSDARLAYTCEPDPEEWEPVAGSASPQTANGNLQPGGERPGRKGPHVDRMVRNLVTLSKQINASGEIHPQIARLRLDEQGKLVKLVVSR